MSKLSPSRCFAMQGEQIPETPDGLPLGEGRGFDALTQSDAAAICAGGLHPKCYYAGRVRFTLDKSALIPLERYLWVEAAGLADREKWPVCIGQTTLRRLSELACIELYDPTRYNSEPARVAWFGNSLNVNQDRAWPMWERTWRPRYQALYDTVYRWSEVAESHVYHRQREDEP